MMPPRQLFNRLAQPVQQFIHIESSGGIVLLVATVLALAWANSPWADAYFALGHSDLTLAGRTLHLSHWVNDGLMVLFFFLVGMELKREVLHGELGQNNQYLMPTLAALGGVLVPAMLFFALNPLGTEGSRGWAIPVATDIAFSLGVLMALGNRVPWAIKVLLTALAIVDDLVAIVIIALGYSTGLNLWALGGVAMCFVGLMVINRLRVGFVLPYAILGLGMWWLMLDSGIHATLAGVMLAVTIPYNLLLQKLEKDLHPWVTYAILPVFALVNAGIGLRPQDFMTAMQSTVFWGVFLGLALGKPLGILLFTRLATFTGLTRLPDALNYSHILGMGHLGGIGFTMSLFIAELAFVGHGNLLGVSKMAILLGSLLSAVLGGALLWMLSRQPKQAF